jgi:hypothetical protein
MNICFDVATNALTIDAVDLKPWGCDIYALLNRHGKTIDLTGVAMSLTLKADAETVFHIYLPPDGVKYERTDQDILATGRVVWRPDQAIEVFAWCRTHGGQEITATASFNSPSVMQEQE